MRGNSVKIVLFSFRKGDNPKREELASFGSNIFHCRVDTFFQEDWYTGKQSGSQENYLPYENWRKKSKHIQPP